MQYTHKEAGDGGTAVPYPLVTVCTSGAAYTPLPCTPKASIYSDAALTVPLANPFRGDMFGNIEFYATPAAYIVSVTAPYSPGYSFKMNGAGGFAGSIASTQVAFGSAVNTIAGDANFTWNNTNKSLTVTNSGVGGFAPIYALALGVATNEAGIVAQCQQLANAFCEAGQFVASDLGAGPIGSVIGIAAVPGHAAAGTLATMTGVDVTPSVSGGAGAITTSRGIHVAGVAFPTGTSPTTHDGIIVDDQCSGSFPATNCTGIRVAAQSNGKTGASIANVNGVRFVDGTGYATIAAALASCPATGVEIISTFPETFASDPFAAVTCPFDIWLIGGASTNIWKTNVGLRIGHNGQKIRGAGPNFTEIQANSGTFPSTTTVISVGTTGPAGVNGSGVYDLAVDCASVAACICYHYDGTQELSGNEHTQCVNAMSEGYRISSDQGAGAQQNTAVFDHIRSNCSASAAAGCIPVHITSTAGARVSIRDVTAVAVNPATVTDCIKNDSTVASVDLSDAHTERCTNGFHNTAAGGLFKVSGLYGNSTVTTLIRNDSASASYLFDNLTLNSSTNTLVDAGRSITTNVPACSVYGVTSPTTNCPDPLVPWESPAPPETSGTKPTITGTGACATSDTKTGGAWAGTFRCTGATGASTVTITFAATVITGYSCPTSDETTANALRQSAHTQTTCVISGTVNQNDILVFTASAF